MKFAALKSGERVDYTGKQPSLVGRSGAVENEKVAANGTISVRFDGDPKAKVAKVSNLRRSALKPTVAPAPNPKDKAVIDYVAARDGRSTADSVFRGAKKALGSWGLVDLTLDRPVGKEVVYESNAVRLTAETAAPGTMITEDSIRAALRKFGYPDSSVQSIVREATVVKKEATTFVGVIK